MDLITEDYGILSLDNNSAYIVYNLGKGKFISLTVFQRNKADLSELKKLLKFYQLKIYKMEFENSIRFISSFPLNKNDLDNSIQNMKEFYNTYIGMNEKTKIDESLFTFNSSEEMFKRFNL